MDGQRVIIKHNESTTELEDVDEKFVSYSNLRALVRGEDNRIFCSEQIEQNEHVNAVENISVDSVGGEGLFVPLLGQVPRPVDAVRRRPRSESLLAVEKDQLQCDIVTLQKYLKLRGRPQMKSRS